MITPIDFHWSQFFGVSPRQFQISGIQVVPHSEVSDFDGAWIFQHGRSGIISVPEAKLAETKIKATGLPFDELLKPATAHELFGEAVDKIVGPAFQGYAEPGDFKSTKSSEVRKASASDANAITEFLASCEPQAIVHSGIEIDSNPLFIYCLDDKITAASNYGLWSPKIAIPGILTHPNYRGRGFGKAVASASMEHAYRKQYLIGFQTLLTNQAAIKLATRLGIKSFGASLAVTFKSLP